MAKTWDNWDVYASYTWQDVQSVGNLSSSTDESGLRHAFTEFGDITEVSLVNDPEIVFLDEPTDGVDPAGRRDFRLLMKRLREEGRTIFINTHILSELEPIVDRVAIVSHGELLGEGVLDDLRSRKPDYHVEYEGALSPTTQASMESGGLIVGSGLITMSTSKAEDVQPVIDQLRGEGLVVSRVERKTQSLEELFMGFVDQSNVAAPPPIPGAPVHPSSLPRS
jgi:ABC-2 type transport system ATP-binding protein